MFIRTGQLVKKGQCFDRYASLTHHLGNLQHTHQWSDPDEEDDGTHQDGQDAGDDDDDDDAFHAGWAWLLVDWVKGGQCYCSSCGAWQLEGIVYGRHHQMGKSNQYAAALTQNNYRRQNCTKEKPLKDNF